jgi:hypothetical protein
VSTTKCGQDSIQYREANRADLVLHEAVRQLARQEVHVDAFHSRSVNLLIVESVVAALCGANSILKPGGTSVWLASCRSFPILRDRRAGD